MALVEMRIQMANRRAMIAPRRGRREKQQKRSRGNVGIVVAKQYVGKIVVGSAFKDTKQPVRTQSQNASKMVFVGAGKPYLTDGELVMIAQ